MRTGNRGIELIKNFEGFRARAYRCPAGVLTIGYGHTYNVHPTDVITKEQAEDLLRQDLDWAEKCVDCQVERELNQNQFDALVSFVFNVGSVNFHYSTLLRTVNRNPDDFAEISRQFARWNRSGGVMLPGLVRRRKAEAELYCSNN